MPLYQSLSSSKKSSKSIMPGISANTSRCLPKHRTIFLFLTALGCTTLIIQVLRLAPPLKELYWLRINTSFAYDCLINLGWASIPESNSHSIQSSRGFQLMRNSNVTILGVARNVEHQLPHVLREIQKISQLFCHSRAIIVQGDSTDQTPHILYDWAGLSTLNRSALTTTKAGLKDELNTHKHGLMPREGVIATARNLGLKRMRSLSGHTEYIIVIDMDILGASTSGLADSFGRVHDWDVVCSHGVILHGLYRDTYAFRTNELNTNHHWGDEQNIKASIDDRKRLKSMSSKAKLGVYALADRSHFSTDLLYVDSCFGGLAIYKSHLFDTCSYSHRYSEPPNMLDCEHVLLHKCMKSSAGARIASNPVMKLWYGAHSLNLKYRDIFGK